LEDHSNETSRLDVVVDCSTSTTVVDVDATPSIGEEEAIKMFNISTINEASVLEITGGVIIGCNLNV
jgi:hypothetical protein